MSGWVRGEERHCGEMDVRYLLAWRWDSKRMWEWREKKTQADQKVKGVERLTQAGRDEPCVFHPR